MQTLQHLVTAQPTQDGAGVKIHRLAGRELQQLMNPFLMIDEIHSNDAEDYIGGFPEHPHRGFETVTYMKAGRMRHRDHMGNEGVIGSGDVQWMTAAGGVLHSEMPEQRDGLLHGFQLWLNLPASEKMKPAQYREVLSKEITEHNLASGGSLKLITGKVTVDNTALTGPVTGGSTKPMILDLMLDASESVHLKFEQMGTSLVYVYGGNTTEIETQQIGIYANDGELRLEAGSKGAEILILQGAEINEPVVQHGPFVMNSMSEIEQAARDFRNEDYVRNLKAAPIPA